MAAPSNQEPTQEEMRQLRRVSLRQLAYFLQLAHERSFGVAAASLAISQPTLSQQIAKLEQQLDLPLVDRTARRFTLTEGGAALAARLAPVLAELGAVLAQARPAADERPLRIGVPSYQSYPAIDALFARMRQRYPSIALQRMEMPAREMCMLLASQQLDAGLMSLPAPHELPAELAHLVLWQARYQLCFPRRSPLAALPALTAAEVAGLEIVVLPRHHHPAQYDFQVQGLRALGIEPRLSSSEVVNVSGQLSLASTSGAACLVCPETLALPADMVARATVPPLPMQRMALFWRKRNCGPSLQRLLIVAREAGATATEDRSAPGPTA